jgi:hypothetical protein
MKSVRVLLIAAVATFGLAASSEAGSVTCPGGGATRSFTVVIPGAPTATCAHSGDGNEVNGDPDDFYTPSLGGTPWVAWDKDPGTASGETAVTDTWFTYSTTPGDTTSGSFTLAAAAWAAYSQIILAIKVGGGPPGVDPTWASFYLPAGWSGTATFNVDPQQGSGISHMVMYGSTQQDIPEVPEPTALALLGSGLALMAFRLRRRKV